ncbi:hypothetical protein X560_2298 [Listeria fleischmannii 1991]|uniref:Lipid A core - O-antigen ligase and related enzymes n=2 Tax=Listeria fleischmannii TaxID=1069827 RepID=A0A2X3HGR8_9LIST|nr:O-antigen ligase family protein [Listeria fleischmannii]EMG28381.1 hypothetical protein LFLEISCH_05864 [Listeria fleischmannii subsp. fleischmannii LU2006-1]KMT58472.1 hypothetical protein X560_2298 [Listeria fleischmannii 1991]SQC69845.1 Lipid A core - O-antigen ligase and related enzymes [Listeria fleischmannii subsp. fleischmannii]
MLKETKLFVRLFAIFPIIDTLNGFALSAGINLPIGVAYRLFCIFFLIAGIFKKGFPKNIYTVLTASFIFSGILTLLIQTITLQNGFGALGNDLSNMVKFFLWVLIPYYIYQRRDAFTEADFSRLFLTISALFTICLLVPYLLGIGNQTYAGSDAGYKAFFFANNDTTIGFIAAATYTGWYLFHQTSSAKQARRLLTALLYIGNLVGLLLLGTKTGIIYGVVLTIVLLIRFFFFQKRVPLLVKWSTGSAVIAVALFAIFKGRSFILDTLSGSIQRLTYFYNLYNGDLIRFITSSRSQFLDSAFQSFTGTGHLVNQIFGFGFSLRVANWGLGDLVEMDFFDVLFSLGFIGVLVTSAVLLYFFIKACQKRSIYSVMFIVLLFYGAFAGHVLFSALSSTLFGLICGALLLKKESLREPK